MTRPSPIIRDSRDADLPAITAIYGHAVREGVASFELNPPDEAEMAARRKALLAADYPYLVAEREGRVAGYAYAGPYRARPAYASTVESTVYVDTAARRSGVARALMVALIEACVGRGYRQMIAVIGDSGNAPSIGLHRAVGFHFAGTLHSVGYKHGRWLDSVLMQRALGPGDTWPPDA